MATPFWQLTNNFIDGITKYLGSEINRLHNITERQVTGTLQILGTGVVKVPDAASMSVSNAGGLNVSVAPGLAVASLAAFGPCVLTKGAASVFAVPANSTRYLFASIERSADNDSLATGKPLFVWSEGAALDGGVLLAQIVAGAAAITSITDRRGFVALGVSASGTPTGAAGGVLSGTYPNVGFAVPMATQTGQDAAIATRAPLASPALTGAPSAPTPATDDNSTRLATTAHVAARVAWIVNTAPASLDTLSELASALANDPQFSSTVFTALAGKAAQNDARLRDDFLLIDMAAAPAILDINPRYRRFVLQNAMKCDVTLRFPALAQIWTIEDESTRGSYKISVQKTGGAAVEMTAKRAEIRGSI